jgi:diguanylate cyclase (GGDEF)-like protein
VVFDQSARPRLIRFAGLALLCAAVYCCVDIAMNTFAFSQGWTILWPLNGFTVALLLMRPRAEWPAILSGVAVGTWAGECFDHNPVALEIWLRFISVTEVLICALLLPAFTTLHDWLRKPQVYVRFFAALVLGPGISGVMAALLLHRFDDQNLWVAFDNWATADALGIAAFMPLALSLRTPQFRALFTKRALPKTLGVLFVAMLTTAFSFSADRYHLLFLVYPALLLVDSVLTFSGSAIAVVGVCLMAIYLTTHHHGPFAHWPAGLAVSSDIGLQIFLGFQILALFPASILFMERRRLEEELLSSNEQLLLLASLDGLTGIANRRSLDERFALEWARGIRLKTPLGLVMIDVDHFKQFNDVYGHLVGDECLCAVAMAISNHVRRAQDHASRYGGEEFALLLPHTELFGAHLIAEKLREAIYNLAIPHSGSPWGRVTVSIGYSSQTPSQAGDRSELLRSADEALYTAKRLGRNRVSAKTPAEQKVL